MDRKRYTVTVYAAAPGTPLRGNRGPGDLDYSHMDRSVPGHVYYATSDGIDTTSYGFGPVEHGDLNGPGKRFDNDVEQYVDPFYARTMEVTQDQFDRLNEFGTNPDHYGFDLTYKDIRNNCVDYTWAALNHAGIQRTDRRLGEVDAKGVDGKLNYLPAQAPGDIRTIRDPIPGSDLNHQLTRDRPAIEWWQIPLSDAKDVGQAQDIDPFDRLCAASVANDDRAFDRVGQDYLQSPEGQAFLQSGVDFNHQQDLAQQQALAQQQQQQQQHGPVMRMTM